MKLIFKLTLGTIFVLLCLEMVVRIFLPQATPSFADRVARASGLDQPKPLHEKRVFVFGASSVIGYHHLGRSSLSDTLAFQLQETSPAVAWKVINFGKAGESSEFVFEAAEAAATYSPDLIVIYTGENEFIPPAVIRRQARFRLEHTLRYSALIRLLGKAVGRPDFSMPNFRDYTYADLVNEIEQEKPLILGDFQARVHQFDATVATRIPVIYLFPVGNGLWPPTFFDNFKDTHYDANDTVDRLFLQGVLLEDQQLYRQAVEKFQKVLDAKPAFADAHYHLALCDLKLGQTAAARLHLVEAVDNDRVPNRALSAIARIYREEAVHGWIIETPEHVQAMTSTAIIGYDWIEDNCHPRIELEFLMAQWILDDPRVQHALGFEKRLPVDYSNYLLKKHLDARYFTDVFARVAAYQESRPSATYWFQKALALSPQDTALQKAAAQSLQKNQAAEIQKRHDVQALLGKF